MKFNGREKNENEVIQVLRKNGLATSNRGNNAGKRRVLRVDSDGKISVCESKVTIKESMIAKSTNKKIKEGLFSSLNNATVVRVTGHPQKGRATICKRDGKVRMETNACKKDF